MIYGNLLLLIPSSGLWQQIGIDLIMDLLKTQYNCIFMVIDHFMKIAHFVLYKKTINTERAANLFVETIIWLYRVLTTIVLDRDWRWINRFWKYLHTRLDIKQATTTAHWAQADGQTERVNMVVETYLQSYCNWKQNDWDKHLVLLIGSECP